MNKQNQKQITSIRLSVDVLEHIKKNICVDNFSKYVEEIYRKEHMTIEGQIKQLKYFEKQLKDAKINLDKLNNAKKSRGINTI